MLVNLEISRKNRQCILITNHSSCHFPQEKNNHISNGMCSYALVSSYYRSSLLCRHTSLLTLARERAAQVLLTIIPDFDATPAIKNYSRLKNLIAINRLTR